MEIEDKNAEFSECAQCQHFKGSHTYGQVRGACNTLGCECLRFIDKRDNSITVTTKITDPEIIAAIKTPMEGLSIHGPDMVNHPPHYSAHPSGVECIQITEHMNFCLGNAVKYIWRADMKNGLEDLEKAAWYINREIARRKAGNGSDS
jgi:hypothetical protein